MFFASPGRWQACPKSAACWSPASAGDGDALGESGAAGPPDDLPGGDHAGQHGAGDVEDGEELVVPVEVVDVEEQGARGVARVGDVGLAAGQVPGEPGVDGAEGELAAPGALARAGDRVEEPGELGSREVGVEHEPGPVPESGLVAGLPERVTSGRGSSVLPDDRVGHGAAGRPVPEHGRLALVGDADRGHVRGAEPRLGEGEGGHVALGGEDLLRVVLHPARLREELAEFLLGKAYRHTRRGRRRSRGNWSCPGRGRGWLSSTFGACRPVDDTIKSRGWPPGPQRSDRVGLLDDLKKQADALKAEDTDRTESLRSNAVAVDHALRRAFLYMNDLGKQLNVVQDAEPVRLQAADRGRHHRAHVQGFLRRLPHQALHRQGLLRRGAPRHALRLRQGAHHQEGPGRHGEVPGHPLAVQHRAQERAVPRPERRSSRTRSSR